MKKKSCETKKIKKPISISKIQEGPYREWHQPLYKGKDGVYRQHPDFSDECIG